jgi:hypothetical protein
VWGTDFLRIGAPGLPRGTMRFIGILAVIHEGAVRGLGVPDHCETCALTPLTG